MQNDMYKTYIKFMYNWKWDAGMTVNSTKALKQIYKVPIEACYIQYSSMHTWAIHWYLFAISVIVFGLLCMLVIFASKKYMDKNHIKTFNLIIKCKKM